MTAEGGNYGAGIGSGGGSYDGGDHITITGGTVNATGGAWGAGIGGGYGDDSDHITITGGTVTAEGGNYGAGIGGGYGGVGDHITIGGGAVTAEGGENGAGIGGGYGDDSDHITITGGKVTAEGGISGAGIGGGYWGRGRNITVSGAAQVTAVAGKSDEDNFSGFGATIGDGYNGGDTRDDDGNLISYGSGKEVQADISGLTTTGYIRHMIYNEDGSVKQEWWEYGHLQPDPDTTENPNAPAEGSNGVSLGTPGLHVETLEGSPLPFNAQRQGRTLTGKGRHSGRPAPRHPGGAGGPAGAGGGADRVCYHPQDHHPFCGRAAGRGGQPVCSGAQRPCEPAAERSSGREPEVPDALKKYRPLTGAALGNHPGRLLFVI